MSPIHAKRLSISFSSNHSTIDLLLLPKRRGFSTFLAFQYERWLYFSFFLAAAAFCWDIGITEDASLALSGIPGLVGRLADAQKLVPGDGLLNRTVACPRPALRFGLCAKKNNISYKYRRGSTYWPESIHRTSSNKLDIDEIHGFFLLFHTIGKCTNEAKFSVHFQLQHYDIRNNATSIT